MTMSGSIAPYLSLISGYKLSWLIRLVILSNRRSIYGAHPTIWPAPGLVDTRLS
jgi:hypothetical protein